MEQVIGGGAGPRIGMQAAGDTSTDQGYGMTDVRLADDLGRDAQIVRLIAITSWLVTGLGFSLAVLFLVESPPRLDRVLIDTVIGMLGVTTLWLLRRGYVRAAIYLITWGVWATTTLLVIQNGGVRGPSMLSYPAIIVFAGWVLGTRHTILLTAVTAVALVVLVWTESQGYLPSPQYVNLPAFAIYLAGIMAITCTMTLVSRGNYQRRVRQSREAAASLAAREAELRNLFQAVELNPSSIAITDPAGRIEYVNAAFEQLSGYSREAAIGQSGRLLAASRVAEGNFEAIDQALAKGLLWKGEFISQRSDGSVYTEAVLLAPIRQPDGHISHILELKQDTTEQRQAAAEIHRLAYFDALTGLPNRTALAERLASTMPVSRREGQLNALVLFNIDRFKTVNDARGQDIGDQLLQSVGARLSTLLAEGDMVARVGADEFALLVSNLGNSPGVASRTTLHRAELVQAEIHRPLQFSDGETATITVSMGITLLPQPANDSPQEVLRRAATALHRAKDMGGGRSAFFEAGMGEAAEQRFRLERELRHAIAEGQLHLYLQPQVNAAEKLVGCEVLMRWHHPEHGIITPSVFISLAEESDLIISLGNWVLGESCSIMAREAGAGLRLHMSVNISPRHFSHASFVPSLREILTHTGADPTLLTLEVTEGLVINDVDAVIATMRAVRALGIALSIDDFGTGYSSLAYLKRLPINELKIDKTFVQDAPTTAEDAALVDIIFVVARHMQLRVVAEGVETEEQARFLRSFPDIVYQGYLYGRPAPAEEWLTQWRAADSHFRV
jgi:diguanylate cyclase (GGDEF)-like protein/PAS domain S-box-containing protein